METPNLTQFWQKNKTSVIVGSVLLFAWILLSFSNTAWFRASILSLPKPFDGTVLPIDQVPNWMTWKGNHYQDNFSTISAKDLINLPQYDPQTLITPDADLKWWYAKDNAVRNAKITYPVVYLGNYELDHREGAGSHPAVDIRVPKGTPVKAVANGLVVQVSEKESGFGHYIVIEHPNAPDYPDNTKITTLYSAYAHLSEIKIQKGQVVNKGDVIALSGDTGTATTPHLHFQIDRKDAPWHPYWPFTSQDATNAGLDFYSAINNGLNQGNAMNNTINPLLWTQANFKTNLTASAGTTDSNSEQGDSTTASGNTSINTTVTEPTLTNFQLSAPKQEASTKEVIPVTVSALDQNGKILTDYLPENLKITADSGSSRYPRKLIFTEGVAKFNFSETKEKNVVLMISDGDAQGKTEFKITSAPTIAADDFNLLASRIKVGQGEKIGLIVEALNQKKLITSYTPPADFVLTLNQKPMSVKFVNGAANLTFIADTLGENLITVKAGQIQKSLTLTVVEKTAETATGSDDLVASVNSETPAPVSYTLKIEGENFSLTGTSLNLTVKAFNTENAVIKDFDPVTPISVTTSGQGILSKTQLTKTDFTNGAATVNYISNVEEDAEITVGGVAFKVSFIAQIKETTALAVEHDGTFVLNKPETITIKGIDENGKLTPTYSPLGKVNFTLIDGQGSFDPKELSAKNFKDGSAQITFTATSDGDVKIKAGNGAIVGTSKYMRVDRNTIFSDVNADHKFAEAIKTLKEKGIISGYSDGSFQPEKTVSRVEALKMILTAFNIDLTTADKVDFTDIESPSWYENYVATAVQTNIVKGYNDGQFKPGNPIIRAEYLKILLEAAKVDLAETVSAKPYDDVDATAWFAKYALFSKENNLFFTSNNTLLPTQAITRGEVADTIYKILEIKGEG